MSYETSAFGSGDGGNVTADVSNHYGQRAVGGQSGSTRQTGLYSEFNINVDADGLNSNFPIVTGALIKEVVSDFATGAITTLTIGGVSVAAADGSALNDVELADTNTGAVVLAGPTAGTVTIRYLKSPA